MLSEEIKEKLSKSNLKIVTNFNFVYFTCLFQFIANLTF